MPIQTVSLRLLLLCEDMVSFLTIWLQARGGVTGEQLFFYCAANIHLLYTLYILNTKFTFSPMACMLYNIIMLHTIVTQPYVTCLHLIKVKG